MTKIEKLMERAKNAPQNLRFQELCQLAEAFGFEFSRQKGSHHIYVWPDGRQGVLSFQPHKDGKAKPYQVRQLLDAIDDLPSKE